eukprot:7221618-Alexandrium_andersonii.AAC.1
MTPQSRDRPPVLVSSGREVSLNGLSPTVVAAPAGMPSPSSNAHQARQESHTPFLAHGSVVHKLPYAMVAPSKMASP